MTSTAVTPAAATTTAATATATATTTVRPPADRGPAGAAGTRPAVRRFRPGLVGRCGLLIVLAVVMVLQAPAVLSVLVTAIDEALVANAGWLLAALTAAVASMVAFAVVRQRTLRVAGAPISLAEATAVSYAAGAVHLTAPAGTVVSTGYAFRRLQRSGVRPAAIAYSLAVSGLVCAVTLAGIAVAGFLVAGSAAGWGTIVAGSAGAVGVATAALWAVRRPDSVARVTESVLGWVNRLLRRPPDAGLITLRATVDDLTAVRPAGRDWVAVTVVAAVNWLLDLGCLWACAHAVGIDLSPLVLMTSYAVAMAGGGVSPLPGGLGVVDGVLVVGLTSAGAPLSAALCAVLLYRVVSNGSVIVGGWTAVAARTARLGLGRRRATRSRIDQDTTTAPVSH